MRTRTISLLTFVTLLLATSCMPDSFTKFKEDPPSKKSASGGSAGEVATPTPTPTPVSSDVVYTVDSVEFYQSEGDTYIFAISDGTNFSVGDTVNFSSTLFRDSVNSYDFAGTITAINTNPDDDNDDSRYIAVKLADTIEINGAGVDIDYDGNFAGFDPNYASDTATSLKIIDQGYYIDNCSMGYGVTASCPIGTYGVTFIQNKPALYINPDVPVTSPFPNAPLKSLSKRIHIVGNGVDDAADLDWDYSFEESANGLGMLVGASEGAANNGQSSDDRILSPYGPFTLSSSLDASTDPLTITVSLASNDYGTQLDDEEQGTVDFYFRTNMPGDAIDTVQEFELSYYIESGQRFAIKVDNVSGFSAGVAAGRNYIRACKVTLGTGCDSDNETVQVVGKARIDFIDTNENILYLTAVDFDHDYDWSTTPPLAPDYPSLFREGLFLHNGTLNGNNPNTTADDGTNSSTFVSVATSTAYRLFNDTEAVTTTITPEWNVPAAIEATADNPTGTLVYSVNSFPSSGFAIDPGTGVITITHASITTEVDKTITVSVTDATNGGVIDTFTLNYNAIKPPTAISFDDGSTSKDLSTAIGTSVNDSFRVTIDGGLEVLTSNDISFASFDFTCNSCTLPTGATIDDLNARITWSPTQFNPTLTSYTLDVTLPAYDPSTAVGSVNTRFLTATRFDEVVFDQNVGELLILRVDDVSLFSSATGSNSISTDDGAEGTINFIDEDNSRLFVSVATSNLSGNQVFKRGDSLDNTSSFIVQRARIRDTDDAVTHVFLNNSTAFDAGRQPKFFLEDGTQVTLDTANSEENSVNWAITPSLPDDLTLSTTGATGGTLTAVSAGNLGNLSPTTFTFAVSNAIGTSVLSDYRLTFIEAPSLPSMNRYQFIRVSGNTNNFYRGSRIQTNGTPAISGRVLMTVDTDDADENVDGLLVEANGDIPNGAGIDNSEVFFADEVLVNGYEFWYVKDVSNFAVSDTLTSDRGDQATIMAIDTTAAAQRLYVRLDSGTFQVADTVTDGGSDSSIIKSIERRHYVTGVIQINSGDWANVIVGEKITWTKTVPALGNGEALVVQKAHENNGTPGITGDDRYYLLIQQVGTGPMIEEGDDFSGVAVTNVNVDAVVGPNVNVFIVGGNSASRDSSTGRVDASGYPFYEGSVIGSFDVSGSNYVSVGHAVHGTDYTYNDGTDTRPRVTVQVEDYFNHFLFGSTNTYFIDDFTESRLTLNMDAEPHNRVTGVGLSNLIVAYVGQPVHLEPSLKGEFAQVSISPDTLPAGLTLDSTTGVISGTPTEPLTGRDYTLTFRTADGTGTATYSFPFVVYNLFEVSQSTTEASSYVVHKEGQGMGTSRCRVITPQIIDDVNDPNYNVATYGMNDIVCLMEGGESDIFNRGLNWDVVYGAGMCEYVQYVPFSYQGFLPGETDREVTIYNTFPDAASCDDGEVSTSFQLNYSGESTETFIGDRNGTMTAINVLGQGQAVIDDTNGNSVFNAGEGRRTFGSAYCDAASSDCTLDSVATQVCSYDYRNVDEDFPNLDEGSVTVRTVNCSYTEGADAADPFDTDGDTDLDEPNGVPDDTTCICNISETVVDCGGDLENGLAGAKRDSGLLVNQGSRIYTTVSGGSFEEEIEAPIAKGFGSNRHIANFVSHRNYNDTSTTAAPFGTSNPSCYASNHHMDSFETTGITGRRAAWDNYSNARDPFGSANSGIYSNYYTFNCLDAAYDIKARIRVLVRDWDREFTPEDHELTNLAANSINSADLAAPLTITTTGSSNSATLSAALPSHVTIGNGTVIYVDDGDNTLELDQDTRFVVQNYVPGSTTVTFQSAASSGVAGRDFFIRSKLNDEESNTFSVAYDNRDDHDSRWISLLSSANRPDYNVCGTGGQETATGQTINITAGEYAGTLTGAVTLVRGSVLEISDGTTTINMMVSAQSGTTVTFMNPAPMTFSAATVRVVNNIPYPAEIVE